MEEEKVEKEKSLSSEKRALRPISWSAHEYVHTEKTPDWYWALGLLTVASGIGALLFNNVLFAILIFFIAFVLSLHATMTPKSRDFSLTQRGVRIDNELHPYTYFKGFSIDEFSPEHTPKLILLPQNFFDHTIIIPIEDVDPDDIHDFLSFFLEDVEEYEPSFHRFMEWLGF
jgi:hypothetical protein